MAAVKCLVVSDEEDVVLFSDSDIVGAVVVVLGADVVAVTWLGV